MKDPGEIFAWRCWEKLLGSISGPAEGENDESTVEAAMSVVSLQQQRWGESDC